MCVQIRAFRETLPVDSKAEKVFTYVPVAMVQLRRNVDKAVALDEIYAKE